SQVSTSSPARVASSARYPATCCSPPRGSRSGKNAGFTLGKAMSSRSNLAAACMRLPFGSGRRLRTAGTRGDCSLAKPFPELATSVFDVTRRIVAELLAGFVNVGAGNRDITRLRRLPVTDGLSVQRLFQQFDDPVQRPGLRLAKVEDLVAELLLRAGHHPIDRVADIGVVTRGRSIAINR